MMYKFSSQDAQFGRVPGGGLGCLIGLAVIVFVTYYALKGLYFILWWAAPALLVLTLIINWRVIPDTLKNWFAILESRPLTGLIMAAFAVLAFPFFALWLFLKALGYRKLESMKQQFQQAQEPAEEFVDFEELESRPMGKPPEPEPLEAPKPPKKEKPKQEENPYDGFFGDDGHSK
ncbi:MAG: hypothetical protein KA138_13625 [Saprospiraceae bacterium]|nr:hypothetical protein [Saprospiraceae bacterium]